MIKVNYDTQTTLVTGYYPDSINYNSIPEPFIEIENEAQDNSKTMCVIGGEYQEYVKPDSKLLEESKDLKLSQITPARDAFMYADIEYGSSIFTNSQVAGNNLTSEIADQTALIEWLDASGNQVDLTLAEAKELSALIKAKRRVGYFKEAALKTQINTIVADGEYFDNQVPPQPLTPVEAVEAINIIF